MVRIQLETGYLEVKEGTDFPLNFGVAEIRDVSKRSGAFSKSIKLIGSDNNNQLLNHYYDVNIVTGVFDINAKTTCSVIQNGLPILEDAYIQLVSVDKVQNDNGHEEGVEYTAVIKDAQADFFTVIDNKELTDVDLTDLNHTYNGTNVQATFNNTAADGYMYPLLFTPTNTLQLTDFKPAVYAKTFWDRIHAAAGFSYEWSTLSADYFDKLIIPFNGGSMPEQDYSSYEVEFEKNSFTVSDGTDITSVTENLDDENIFNPTTGVYTTPFYIGTGGNLTYKIEFTVDFEAVNSTGANAYLQYSGSTGLTEVGTGFGLNIMNGATVESYALLGNATFALTDNPLPNGTTSLGTFSGTLLVPVNYLNSGDNLNLETSINLPSLTNAWFNWFDAVSGGTQVSITTQLNFTSLQVNIVPSVNILGFGQEVQLNQFIPKKIKQRDFISSIITMYNLYVEPDKDNPNKLIYKSRDDYYDGGAEKDWTAKLAKNIPQELEFLPDLSAKKLLMTYKQDDDNHNRAYEEATNEVYGQVEFTFNNEYVKGVDKKEIIFSPTPMVWNGFNCIVPAINAAAPEVNIRILIHNGTANCDSFTIQNYNGNLVTSTTYPQVSHFDDHFNPTFDINFAPCDYYFYQPIFALTNNNLFNTYWRRTVGQINEGKMLTAYFDLREDDIATLKLSDKIRIDNSWWNINRVADYNPNKEQLTKVELISVDDEIELPSFRQSSGEIDINLFNSQNNNGGPKNPLPDAYYDHNNSNYGNAKIYGVGNTVLPNVKAFVIGDYGLIDEDGFWLNGVRIGEETDADSGSKDFAFRIVSSNYSIDCEFDEIIEADTAGITLTLPNRRNCVGKKIYIKNYSGGNITLTTATSNIDGVASLTVKDKESVTVTSDETRWIIL